MDDGWIKLIGAIAVALVPLCLATLKSVRSAIWRYILCPAKKLAFPMRDAVTQIKQSRMRYQLVEFKFRNGECHTVFQVTDSNGASTKYQDASGARFLPAQPNESKLIDGARFEFPRWRKIDWGDVFNGDLKSGRWAIENPD
jgi:hypothetical protein